MVSQYSGLTDVSASVAFFLFLSVTQTADGLEAFSTCVPQICRNHKCEPETLLKPQLSADAASCGFHAVQLYCGARSAYYNRQC